MYSYVNRIFGSYSVYYPFYSVNFRRGAECLLYPVYTRPSVGSVGGYVVRSFSYISVFSACTGLQMPDYQISCRLHCIGRPAADYTRSCKVVLGRPAACRLHWTIRLDGIGLGNS